jgi:hypothetical protein
VNIYIGRDGIARKGDVKLTSGNFLEKRSITRLAKLEIDRKSFGEAEICPTDRTERTERTFGENNNNRRNILAVKLINSNSSIMELSREKDERLILALGTCKFVPRDDLIKRRSEYIDSIRDYVSTQIKCEDPENELSIKINRLPPLCSIYEVISELTKLNWSVTRVMVDSVTQPVGYFAFVTLDSVDEVNNALELGNIMFRGRNCKISRPTKPSPSMDRKQFEYALFEWHRIECIAKMLLIGRKSDSKFTRHAVSCINDEVWPRFMHLKRAREENIDPHAPVDDELREAPTVRSFIVRVPPEYPIASTSSAAAIRTSSMVPIDQSSDSDSDDSCRNKSKRYRKGSGKYGKD